MAVATQLLEVPARREAVVAALPWTAPVAALAATSIVVGVIWDISWHRTIGRDTFWTPAHMAIYLGGLLAGLSGGWQILRATFGGPIAESGVRIWGFRGPLGAWISVWGAVAMLTSAPFDDWWHNAYGLDVEILSPPHVLLGLGMIAIQIGSLVMLLSLQNRASSESQHSLAVLFAYAAGALLLMVSTMFMTESLPNNQHRVGFYRISAIAYPLFLVAVARASRLRWPATTAAALFMALGLAMTWILPLFPARPLLGPIFNPIDRMVPAPFPLLLVVPALAVDYLMSRVKGRDWLLALALGIAFVGVFFVVQWRFSDFLLSPAARNWFFASDRWDYNIRPGSWRYEFWGQTIDPMTGRALVLCMLFGAAASRLGLWWGNWMRRVVR
jgi:hypothetical protein